MKAINAAVLIAASYAAPPPSALNIPTMQIGKDSKGNAVLMPLAGAGTWLYNDTAAEAEVLMALKLGARLIDTANIYENQVGIGRAIKKAGVPLSDLFITTKVPGGLTTDATIAAHEQNLQQLGVDSVDLLLTHFPCGFPTPPATTPVNCSKQHRQATWKGLEAMYYAGKARSIGVSHYCQKHMEDVLEIATVKPSVNQQEWHVGMGTDPVGVVSFCKQHGISYQSFSPLCGPCSKSGRDELLFGPLVTSIGKAHNVSGAQVSLKWLVQQGSPVIPKSSVEQHLREDLDLFSFTLSDAEMAQLSALTTPPSAEPVSGDCKLPTDNMISI
eukprot:CAMPEP_0169115380 /NCGR_PEP_ID=MMETSP1015-20121227/29305_1 /TAXON_ID=342587 /ORGANISM="Karlodinium micrum, Strain CCMP2283" /LENGTH=328 /DNA_ID=CAMNT_0009177815 /DNA_START=58 /DNA_END=1044 /DNA_ORIENTATION=-